MLKDTLVDAINRQINAEIYSAYLYQAIAAKASELNFPGVANWFSIQVKEELSHAQKFYAYIESQGANIKLMAIDEPPADYQNALDMFEKTLEHEQHVTSLINALMDLAREERDHATEIFLQWFVTEQVEEEENAMAIIGNLRLAGTSGGGMFMIDRELASRVFTPPAAG